MPADSSGPGRSPDAAGPRLGSTDRVGEQVPPGLPVSSGKNRTATI